MSIDYRRWTSDDIALKQGLIKATAWRYWQKHRSWMDQAFLDDLEQSGWEGALATTPEDPLLSCRVEQSMRIWVRYWRLGIKYRSNTTADRKIIHQIPMEKSAVGVALQRRMRLEDLPEPTAILRQVIRCIWHRCTQNMQYVWYLQVMQDGLRLERRDYDALHLNFDQVSYARNRLKLVAGELLRISDP